MSTPTLSLRSVFGNEVNFDAGLTADVIKKMMEVSNNYGNDAYNFLLDSQYSSRAEFEKSGNVYKLYSRSHDSSGAELWVEIVDADMKYISSMELYLKAKKVGGSSVSETYVPLTSLISLNVSALTSVGTYNLGTKLAAVAYAISCLQMKLMDICISDIRQISDELRIITSIMPILNQIKDDLSSLDFGSDNINMRHRSTIPMSVFNFFDDRKLIDDSLLTGVLTGDALNKVVTNYYGEVKAPYTAKSIETIVPFEKAWISFMALLSHYRAFFPSKLGSLEGTGGVWPECYNRRHSELEMAYVASIRGNSSANINDAYDANNNTTFSDVYNNIKNVIISIYKTNSANIATANADGTDEYNGLSDEDKAETTEASLQAKHLDANALAYFNSPSGQTDLGNRATNCVKAAISSGSALLNGMPRIYYTVEVTIRKEAFYPEGQQSRIVTDTARSLMLPDSIPYPSFDEAGRLSEGAPWIAESFLKGIDNFVEYITYVCGEFEEIPTLSKPGSVVDTDLFSSNYWRPADGVDGRPTSSIPGGEVEYYFDPRARTTGGKLINVDGTEMADEDANAHTKCVYVKGFKKVPFIGEGGEDQKTASTYTLYDHDGGLVVQSDTPVSYVADFSVRYYGGGRPTSCQLLERSMASIFRNSTHGPSSIPFIPSEYLDASGCFADSFKYLMEKGMYDITYQPVPVTGVEDSESRTETKLGNVTGYIANFSGDAVGVNSDAGIYITGTAEQFRTKLKETSGESVFPSYWPIIEASGPDVQGGKTATIDSTNITRQVTFSLNKDVNASLTDSMRLSGDHITFWGDALRIYNDYITDEFNKRKTEMETYLKFSQQDRTVATNLLKSVGKMRFTVEANIR
ncbi:MAG: hypothetical protein LBS68_00610 [Puniceicoccales bacterium]|jgi:hypothetical protein|nr:hypothetical protein [Puniceicoccales bacterium]